MINLILTLALLIITALAFFCGMAWGVVCVMGEQNELERTNDQRRA